MESLPQTLLQAFILVWDVLLSKELNLIPVLNFVMSLASTIFGFVDCRIYDYVDKIDFMQWDYLYPNMMFQNVSF